MYDDADRAAIRARFQEVDSSNVSDVLDDLGHPDQALSADFVSRTGPKVAGWAYTITGRVASGGGPTDPRKVDACGGVGPDEVTVWAGDGAGSCCFGELIALGLQQRGCVGAIVEGGVRDLSWIAAAGFPVFSTYRTPVQSIGRWQVVDWQQPTSLPGATRPTVPVRPGDFVLADDDGAIVIPAEHVVDVLERAEAVTEREIEIRNALRSGTALHDAIARFGPI